MTASRMVPVPIDDFDDFDDFDENRTPFVSTISPKFIYDHRVWIQSIELDEANLLM